MRAVMAGLALLVAVLTIGADPPAKVAVPPDAQKVIARDVLAPNTAFTATVEAKVDGEAWKKKWSFATGK